MNDVAVRVEGLTVRARGRTLLDDAAMTVGKGEVVLLVGLSGSGKSLTLKLLAGLLPHDARELEIAGTALLFGRPAAEAARDHAGLVFQDFGLFDEWDARGNVGFGFDHQRRRDRGERAPRVDALLETFDLEPTARVATMSGGMKQRCAVARTLAFDPELILYDEPTSGLDPAMSDRVAELIRDTNDRFGKTSLVVTHDIASLARIADRIVLLDPARRSFREVGRDEVDAVLSELRRLRAAPEEGGGRGARRDAPLRLLAALGDVVAATGRAVVALVPRWPRPGWGLRYLWYYLRLTTLGSALVYVGISGFILGLIVTYFTFSFLPFKQYTEPLLIDRIIAAIGFSLYRIMAPGMTAMLIAARSGAALAADVGNRVYSRQTDALRSFGVHPDRYLLGNALWAQLLGMPILLAVNFLCARAGSLLVFVAVHPERSTWFWKAEFERFLVRGEAFWDGTGWVLAKSLVSAFGVVAIAVFQGMRPKNSGREVASAVTLAIIWSTLFVLLVQLVFALAEFEPL